MLGTLGQTFCVSVILITKKAIVTVWWSWLRVTIDEVSTDNNPSADTSSIPVSGRCNIPVSGRLE